MKTTLFDLVEFQRGFDITKAEQSTGNVPIISSSGISSFHNKAKCSGPGIITGRKGTLGKVFYYSGNYWPHDTTLWVKDYKSNYPKYCFYFLNLMRFETYDTGASNPTLNRNHIHKLKIPTIPPFPIQKKIAAVLSAYDDLIETNERRIQVLETMAEELYKEWFVRLRFPGYESTKIVKGVPEGWEVKNLSEIADITYGFPFEGSRFNSNGIGIPIIRIRNIPESKTSDFTDEVVNEKYKVYRGDLLIGMDGEFHINHWFSETAYLVQRSCRIKAKNEKYRGYLAKAIVAPIKHFESYLQGATVGHLGAKHLNSINILIPGNAIDIGKLNIFLDIRINLESINRLLKTARDRLLSRLVSRKIDLTDLDIQFPLSMEEA